MAYCRLGNPIIPNFYIFPVWHEDKEDEIAICVTDRHQELELEQAEYFRGIFMDWIKWEILDKSDKKDIPKIELHGWFFSIKVNEAGNKVLAIEFPDNFLILRIGQVAYLIRILKGWLNQQKRR